MIVGAPVVVLTDPNVDIQAAIDTLPNGGQLILGPGTFTTSTGLVTPDGMTFSIIGQGPNVTNIVTTDPDIDILTVQGDFSSVRNLRIAGPGTSGTGRGLVLGSPTMNTTDINVQDVFIEDTARECLYLEGIGVQDRGYITILSRIQRCRFRQNVAAGAVTEAMTYVGVTCAGIRFEDCAWTDFTGRAMFMDICDGISFERCSFDAPVADTHQWVLGSRCRYVKLRNCWFEVTNINATLHRVWLGGQSFGIDIDGCNFESDYGYPAAISIGAGAAPDYTAGVRITNCWGRVGNVVPFGTDHIYIGADTTKVCVYGGGIMDAAYPVRTLYDWTVDDASGIATVEPLL